MLRSIKDYIKRIIKRSGWMVIRDSVWNNIVHGIPTDYEASHIETYNKVKDFTMTSSERIVAVCSAVDYLIKNNIKGDIVGCGIWRGGAIMAAINTLLNNKITDRQLYLYDTFEGMTTSPHPYDIKSGGNSGVGKTAQELYENATINDFVFCYSSLSDVRQNISCLDYPDEKIHYIKGLVENTIPATCPQKIALLYLNICFYESVLHTLNHLYPLLVPGGVIIISDYGDWEGTKKAVNEYIESNKIQLLLQRVDAAGRVGVKP